MVRLGIQALCGVITSLTLLAPAQAVIVDFNAPSYSDGQLVGQTDTGGATWTQVGASPVGSIGVLNTGTNGHGVVGKPAVAGDNKALLALPSIVTPAPDGKITVSIDLIAGAGATGTFNGKIALRDSAGIEVMRIDTQTNLARGRGQGGAGIVTNGMSFGGIDPNPRTILMVIDTTGAGNTTTFYQDSISPANLLGGTNPITYPGTLDNVAQVYLESAGSGAASDAYFDNINIVPEPASLLLLGLASVGLMHRRRTA